MRSPKFSISSLDPNEGRSTQKEIARRLKISQTSVSRALAKSSEVSQETIRKVFEEARKLGYRPDPALSSLIAYRTSKRPLKEGQSLAWITHYPSDPTFKTWGHYFKPLYEGARIRANQLGYHLEIISTSTPGITPQKILKVLSYRKVEGLIFPPMHRPISHLNVPLDQFSSVAIGYTLYAPHLDLVTHTHFRSMVTTYRKLISYGYRRIGLIFNMQSDARSSGLWSAAYYQQQIHKRMVKLPILEIAESNVTALKAWFKKWKPDAVMIHLGVDGEILNRIAQLGITSPRDLGITLLSIPKGFEKYSGIDEHITDLGALAVDTLVTKIRNHEKGIPKIGTLHMINGEWKDGQTLRRPSSVVDFSE